jgi:hypothetical protein
LQEVDLVFERLSLLEEPGYHRIFPRRKGATLTFDCFNDIARQLEERSTFSLLVGD